MSSAVHETVTRAQEALDQWWRSSPDVRAQALAAIADTLETERDGLVAIADTETHLGAARLTGEVARTCFQLRMFASALTNCDILAVNRDAAVAGAPPEGHPELVRTYVPLGVVGVFGASNFPFAFGVLGGDTASALAAGCCVVAKEHPAHPRLSELLVQVARAALSSVGAPVDVLTSVAGLSEGLELVADSRVKAVGFTGSLTAGRALFDVASSRPDPIPFYGELSSVNPVVVTPRAGELRADEIAAGFVESMTLSGGQFCTKPAILIAPRSAQLAEKARDLIARMPGMTLLTEAISSHYSLAMDELRQRPGVKVEMSTNVSKGMVGAAVLETDIDEFLDPDSPVRQECFGPSAVVVPYDDPKDAVRALAIDEGVLVGCVHGEEDEPLAATFLQVLERRAGRVVWNGWPTGVAVTANQMHGGPWPSSTTATHTSVGLQAVYRFARPVVLQSWPAALTP